MHGCGLIVSGGHGELARRLLGERHLELTGLVRFFKLRQVLQLIENGLSDVLVEIDLHLVLGPRPLANQRIHLFSDVFHEHFQNKFVASEACDIYWHRAGR